VADARQKQDLRLRGPANSKHDLAETEQDLEALLRRIVCGTLPPSSAHGNGVWRRRFRSGPEYTLAEVPAPKLEAKIRWRGAMGGARPLVADPEDQRGQVPLENVQGEVSRVSGGKALGSALRNHQDPSAEGWRDVAAELSLN